MARRALGPATLAVVQAVDATVRDDDATLVVACSGGADSLALAFATRHVTLRRELGCAAVIVDHGLQPGSAAVAERAREQLRAGGFDDVEVVRVRVPAGSPAGPEAAARDARHAALADSARARSAVVLLGHTLDDQAETVLLGLARGSGLRSLAGMSERNGTLLRPLLTLRRSVTVQACAEIGWAPWQDPQNENPRFSRVRVRRTVLPVLEAELGPGVALALARTAALARADTDLLDQLASEEDPGTDDLGVLELLALPPALRSRVIRRWLVRGGAIGVQRDHVGRVEDLVSAWRGQGAVDLPGVAVERVRGRLQIRPGA
jgi:tRNA(Ile)-lysidine synthase